MAETRPEKRRIGLAAARHDLGLMGIALGALGAPPFALALLTWSGGGGAVALALLPLIALGLLGAGVVRRERSAERRGGAGLATLALGWIAAGVLAAVPFWLAATLAPAPSPTLVEFRHPLVALFEGVSGITGTGLSVSRDASELPAALQLYRSMLQWVGSIGLLLCGLVLVDRSRAAFDRHEHQAGGERTLDVLAERPSSPVVAVWASYAVLTLLAFFAFVLSGMPLWESLNHALTGISTGGFTVTSDSFQSYGAGPLVVGAAVMVLGAVSFAVHAAALALRLPARSERLQLAGYVGLLITGVPLVWLFALRGAPGAAPGGATDWLRSAFQWTSGLTTTGFSADPLSEWSGGGILLLAFAMFVGACSGSTGGGLKMRRAINVVVGIGRRIAFAARAGENDEDARDGDETLDSRVRDASARLCLLTFVLGSGLLAVLATAPAGASFEHALLDATAALSTAGLTTGFVSPDLPAGTLLVFCALMLLGRLEVIAVLALAMLTARRLWSMRRPWRSPRRRERRA